MLTVSMLRQVMPNLSREKAEEYLPFLLKGMAEFRINNELRVSAYLAQLAQESLQLTHWVENLNYSADRLTEVWHARFPTHAVAAEYANNPQKLANKVYNGRMGNRSGSNDGWLYRGRMPIQATGREMYEILSDILGVDLVADPDLCLNPEIAFRASAAIFARVKNCNPLADGILHDPNNFTLITKRINGGTHGLKERLEYFRRARKALPDNLIVQGEQVLFVGQETNHFAEADVSSDSKPLPIVQPIVSLPIISPDQPAPAEDVPNPQNDNQNINIEVPGDKPTINVGGETSSSPAAPGDAPEAEPRFSINIQDFKPFVQKWLKRIWGGFFSFLLAKITALAALDLSGVTNWQIALMIGAVLFVIAFSVVVLVSIILLLILLWNRIENFVSRRIGDFFKASPHFFNPLIQTETKGN